MLSKQCTVYEFEVLSAKILKTLLIIVQRDQDDLTQQLLFQKVINNRYYLEKSSSKTKALDDTHNCVYGDIMPEINIYLKQCSKTTLFTYTYHTLK